MSSTEQYHHYSNTTPPSHSKRRKRSSEETFMDKERRSGNEWPDNYLRWLREASWQINKQREIIALDRQGTQQQRPESPTSSPSGVRVNMNYTNSTKGTSSKKEGNMGLYVHRNHSGLLGTGKLGGSRIFISYNYSLHCHHQNDSALRWAAVWAILMFH